MYQCSYNRVENSKDCKYDCNEIQSHGKTHVTFNSDHHSLGKCDQMRQFFYLVIYQCNVCSIDCNVTSYTAHSDSHVSFL